MATIVGYKIVLDIGAVGPSLGDDISGGSTTASFDTDLYNPLGTGVVNYPTTVGDTAGTFYDVGGNYYFVPDDASGFPTGETGDLTSFADAIYGTTGNDAIIGTADGELIYDTDGNIYNPSGDDTISAGGGNDTIIFGDGSDVIYGGTGNDVIGSWSTGSGNNTIYGEGGNDTIIGGAGDDQIYGGIGDDWLSGGLGTDNIDGGDGSDSIWVTDNHETVNLTGGEGGIDWDILGFGNYATTLGVSVTFSGYESGTYDFIGTSTSGVFNQIEEIISTEYDDTIDASASSQDLLTYTLGGADTVTGGSGADQLYVGAGDDVADGGAGDDQIYGDAGDDILSGGSGVDLVYGDDGADILSGGADDDTLSGGAGDDVFVYGDGSGNDTITDFDMGDSDANGFTNDQLDVSALTDGSGAPVNTSDVVVSDDGSGNAVLTFPNGESITLNGVAPASVTPSALISMGVPCFTTGTLIRTPSGDRALESLRAGDLVTTADNGAQPVLWCGQTQISSSKLKAQPKTRPILISRGALGNTRDMLVSRQHGMVLGRAGKGDHLVRAIHLARSGGPGFRIANGVQQVTYLHLMFAQHQIIFAENAQSESFYPGPMGLSALSPIHRTTIFRALPELALGAAGLAAYGPRARPVWHCLDLGRQVARSFENNLIA